MSIDNFLISECIEYTPSSGSDYSKYFFDAATVDIQSVKSIMSDETQRRAVVSLDQLFLPISTDIEASGIPHLRKRYENEQCFDKTYLCIPSRDFESSDNDYVGEQLPTTDGEYRFVGLRNPIYMAGYGRDTAGDPVPNLTDVTGYVSGVGASGILANSGDYVTFASGYQNRADIWKAGPIDYKWDRQRKVWTSFGVNIAYLRESVTAATGEGEPTAFKVQDITRPSGLLTTLKNYDMTLAQTYNPSGTPTLVIYGPYGDELIPLYIGC